jgi:hypothetical protein
LAGFVFIVADSAGQTLSSRLLVSKPERMLTVSASRHLSTFVHPRNKLAAGGLPVPTVRQFIFEHPNPQAAVDSGANDDRLSNDEYLQNETKQT